MSYAPFVDLRATIAAHKELAERLDELEARIEITLRKRGYVPYCCLLLLSLRPLSLTYAATGSICR